MEYLHWLLLLLGLVLIFIEVFFVPGGVVGIAGFGLLMAGVFLIGKEHGMIAGALSFLASFVAIVVLFVLFFRSPASHLMILKDQLVNSQSSQKIQIGDEGVTQTSLYPTGKARFSVDGEEKIVDVNSESGFIDRNLPIVVTKVTTFKVNVRRKEV